MYYKVKRIVMKTLAPIGPGVTDLVVDVGGKVLDMRLVETGVEVELEGLVAVVPLSNVAVLIPVRETAEQASQDLERDAPELGLRKGRR